MLDQVAFCDEVECFGASVVQHANAFSNFYFLPGMSMPVTSAVRICKRVPVFIENFCGEPVGLREVRWFFKFLCRGNLSTVESMCVNLILCV